MSDTYVVLHDPDGLVEAELLLDRTPYEALVTAVLARKDRTSPLRLRAGENLLPGAVGGLFPQAVVCAFPRSEVLGQVHPRCPGAVLERDRVDHLPVITPPPTPLRSPVRQ